MEKKQLSRRDFLKYSSLAAAGLAFAACTPAAQPTQEEAGAAEAPVAEAPKAETVKWIFWPEWGGKDADALEAQVKKFNEQENAEVEYLPIRDHARMIASMSAGEPPDLLMTWDAGAVGSWGFEGGLRDLTPYIQGANMNLDEFLQIGLDSGNLMGTKQIGLPLTNYITTVLYWNKAGFTKAGLDPEVGPETWDDVWTFNEKLTDFTNNQLNRLGYVLLAGQDGHPMTMAYAFGGSIWGPDYRTVTPDSEENIAALKWMRQFYEKYSTAEMQRWTSSLGTDASTPTYPLYNNDGAMMVNGEWMPSYIERLEDAQVEVGFGYLPYSANKPGGKGTMCANTNPLVIPTGSKNPDTAFKFIGFINEPENSAEMCAIVGNASPTKKGVELQISKTESPMYKMILQEVWSKANVVPLTVNTPIGSQYNDAWTRYRDEVLQDGKDATERMTALKEEIQPLLDEALGKLGI